MGRSLAKQCGGGSWRFFAGSARFSAVTAALRPEPHRPREATDGQQDGCELTGFLPPSRRRKDMETPEHERGTFKGKPEAFALAADFPAQGNCLVELHGIIVSNETILASAGRNTRNCSPRDIIHGENRALGHVCCNRTNPGRPVSIRKIRSPAAQKHRSTGSSCLRVLREREFERVGATMCGISHKNRKRGNTNWW